MKRINAILFRFLLGFVAIVYFNVTQAASEEAISAPESPPSTTAASTEDVANARVARLSDIQGEVSFLASGETEWVAATRNRPLVKGDGLWTDSGAHAILQLDNGTVCVAERTSLTVSNLDVSQSQFEQESGSIYVQVRELKQDQTYEIDTPNLAFSISQSGEYRIDVDAKNDTTTVSVLSGQAEVYGENGNHYSIEAGKTYRFTGKDLGGYEPAEVNPEDFQWCALTKQEATPTEKRYVSPKVIGYEDLEKHGTWSYRKGYGNVWQPAEVSEDWAPYRDGHWSWVKPWGWTWIADEAWGFAPFHYGRWVYDAGWYWVPGAYNATPVYAPALVVFLGNVALGGNWGPGVGWFPLGFNQIYWPPYPVGVNYFVNINIGNTVFNSVYITNVFNQGFRNFRVNFINRRLLNGVTVVPRNAFVQGRAVRQAMVKANKAAIKQARIANKPLAKPTRKSITGQARKAKAHPPAKMQSKGVVKKKKGATKHPVAPGKLKKHPKKMQPGKKVKSPEFKRRPTIKAPAQRRDHKVRQTPGREKVKPHRPAGEALHPGRKPERGAIDHRQHIKPAGRPGQYHPGRHKVKPGRHAPSREHVKPIGRPGQYHPGRHKVRPGHHAPIRGQIRPQRRPDRYHPSGGRGIRPHAPGHRQMKPQRGYRGGGYRPAKKVRQTPYFTAPGWQIKRFPGQQRRIQPGVRRNQPVHMQRQFRGSGRHPHPGGRRRF